MIRIGIIGCGKITERASLPNLLNYKQAKVAVLCDVIEWKAINLARQFHIHGVCIETNWRRVVKRKDLDAIFVNTPNYLHCRMAVAAAGCGKHILVEKPMTTTLREADQMIRAAKRNKVILMVEQTQRFEPLHKVAKKVIESGALGKINMIRGRIGNAGPEYWSGRKYDWFYKKSQSGGGSMMDIGVHMLDLVRWFTGKEVKEVKATVTTIEKKAKVEDNSSVLLTFKDGTLGLFESSWTNKPFEVTTSIYGTKGKMITSLGYPDPIIVYTAKTGKGEDPGCILKEIRPKVPQGSGWNNSIHHFLDCVRKREKPNVPGEEGRKTLQVIMAAYRSGKTGKKVRVS